MEINGPSVFSSPVTSVSRRLHACFVQWIKLQNKFIWNYVVVEFVLFSFNLAISCYLMLIICSIYDAQRQLICIILLLYRTDLCCTKAKLISMTYSSRTHCLREMLFSLYRLAMLCGKAQIKSNFYASLPAMWWVFLPLGGSRYQLYFRTRAFTCVI